MTGKGPHSRLGFLFAFLLIGHPAPLFAARGCLAVAKLIEFDPRLAELSRTIGAIKPSVLGGGAVPTPKDFETLEKASELLRRVRADAPTQHKLKALDRLLHAAHSALGTKITPTSRAKKTYRPTDYEFKLAFQNSIRELNALLPETVRIPLATLAPDPRRPALVQQAIDLVRVQREKIAAQIPTMGYPDVAAFLAAGHSDAESTALLKLLAEERLEVVVRAPDTTREWLAPLGFHNLHVTKTTSMGLVSISGRNRGEAIQMGLKLKAYEALDPELKPKYGYARAAPDTGLRNEDEPLSTYYGKDAYILSLDKVRDRLTCTPSDSFIRARGADGWDKLMWPWEDRALLAPFLYENFREGVFFPSRPPPGGPWASLRSDSGGSDYVEIQIWGPLTLDDVETFEFSGEPPTGRYLAELRARNIKIRDGRRTPAVPW